MSKIQPCKSCGKEVAKSAKKCPHCGEKLKMGFMKKFAIFVVAIIVLMKIMSPSAEDFQAELDNLQKAQESGISSGGELAEMFGMMSKNTDIQRDNKEAELKGKIVKWTLPVYEVKLKNKEENSYKIQTSGSGDVVGTFVTVYARDAAEAQKIEALTTDTKITVKGEIDGVFMRNVQIEKARMVW